MTEKRKIRNMIRVKENNKSDRPILSVSRSNKNISAQVLNIDGNIVVSSTSSSKDMKVKLKGKSGIEIADFVGIDIAKKAMEKGIKEIVFNKSEYRYSGRVKTLADAARKTGLIF
ncbi:MAG: 50S ribosomal protein L18 [Rickettsiales bacterium]|jgi:large subunit ribosomal protein L18|nr:50S ribosomal protein L18 [Rickettsiales bacterium]